MATPGTSTPTHTASGTHPPPQDADTKTIVLALPSSVLSPPVETSPTSLPHGRFLTLPHPRTRIPSYFLPSSNDADASSPVLLELTALSPSKPARSWFISSASHPTDPTLANRVHSPATLTLLTPVDPLFLAVSLLAPVFPLGRPGRFVPYEDMWDAAALHLYRGRMATFDRFRTERRGATGLVDEGGGDVQTEEVWEDVVRFGQTLQARMAVQRCCDVQGLTDSTLQTYRLSPAKTFALLDAKLRRLAQHSTFQRAPDTLMRSFDRRFDGTAEAAPSSPPARALRCQIAAEVVQGYLDPEWADAWVAQSRVFQEEGGSV